MEIKGILETCLYADDLNEAEKFYSSLPGLQFISKEDGRHLFYKCGNQMLLIFNPNHTANEQTDVDGKPIPLHGSTGSVHIAFSINREETGLWKEFLKREHIRIESEVAWPNGAQSLYFRDPAGNSLEVASSGLWE